MVNKYKIIWQTTLVVILLFATNFCFAQKKITVKGIKGVGYIAGDVSENQARQNAINDAKVNALKQAGIEEHINTYQTLFSSQNSNDFSQFFSSDIQSEMQGAVESCKIISEEKTINSVQNKWNILLLSMPRF